MKIKIPENALYVVNCIQAAGYEAYVVGGCVRDSILGREPKDWDITTSALPEQVKKIFPRTIDTGIQHGTVTIMRGNEGFEVTTYRIDGKYEDGRHPKEVTFTPCLEEDLKRRDFTINAMAYNDKDGLVDLYDGMGDIERQVIRCVGVAEERFTEDALRIMRAVRFAAQLGYSIESSTEEAITRLAPTLEKISAERVHEELIKMMTSDNPGHIDMAMKMGITKIICPELDEAAAENEAEWKHTLEFMQALRPDKTLRMAALFHMLDRETTGRILKRLKYDNKLIDNVSRLVGFYREMDQVPPTPEGVRRAMNRMRTNATALFELLLEIREAAGDLKYARELRAEYQGVLDRGEQVTLKGMAVTGQDLIEAGVPKGVGMKDILEGMLDMILADPSMNNKEKLLATLDK